MSTTSGYLELYVADDGDVLFTEEGRLLQPDDQSTWFYVLPELSGAAATEWVWPHHSEVPMLNLREKQYERRCFRVSPDVAARMHKDKAYAQRMVSLMRRLQEGDMPVMSCEEEGKPGYKYGETGTCYTYTPGDPESRARARAKAEKQGQAIEISRHQGEPGVPKPRGG